MGRALCTSKMESSRRNAQTHAAYNPPPFPPLQISGQTNKHDPLNTLQAARHHLERNTDLAVPLKQALTHHRQLWPECSIRTETQPQPYTITWLAKQANEAQLKHVTCTCICAWLSAGVIASHCWCNTALDRKATQGVWRDSCCSAVPWQTAAWEYRQTSHSCRAQHLS